MLLAPLLALLALQAAATPVRVHKQPVKYKGPLVYSGLPPPVIHFAGRPGSGGNAQGVEFVPLPYKDLPILIYRSREHPPIHVVSNPENEVQQEQPPQRPVRFLASPSEFAPTYVRPTTSFLRSLWSQRGQPSESIVALFRPRKLRPFKQDHLFIEAPAAPNPIYIPPPPESYFYGPAEQPSNAYSHFFQRPFQVPSAGDLVFAGRPEATDSYAQLLTSYRDPSTGGYSGHRNVPNFDLQTSASEPQPSASYPDPSQGDSAYPTDQMASESSGVAPAMGLGSPRLMGGYALLSGYGGRYSNPSNVNYNYSPESLGRMPYNAIQPGSSFAYGTLKQEASENYGYAESNPSEPQKGYNDNEQNYYQEDVGLEGLRTLTKALGLKKPMEFLSGYGNQGSQNEEYSYLVQDSQNVYEDFNPHDYHQSKDEEPKSPNEIPKGDKKPDEMPYKSMPAHYPKIHYKVPPTMATAAPKHYKPPIIIYQGIRPPVHVYSQPDAAPRDAPYGPTFSMDSDKQESESSSYVELHPVPNDKPDRADPTKS